MLGKDVVQKLRSQLEEKIKKAGKEITLAILIVGDDAASHVYKNRLVKLAEGMGIKTDVRILPQSSDDVAVLAVVEELNNDDRIDGILPMMPLPKHIDTDAVAQKIAIEKDVDCLNPINVGFVYMGKSPWAPCTPRAVMETLKFYEVDLTGKHVVIVGRSNVVGKPLATLMLEQNATVTVCHSKTKDLAKMTSQADVVVVAIGVPEFLQADMVKENAIIVDVGINQVGDKIVGDASEAALQKAASYTPVPGGIGGVSTMMVMQTLLRKY